MAKFKVYFSIGDRNMFMVVEADGKLDAENKIRGRLRIHRSEKIKESEGAYDTVRNLMNMFGIK